MPYAIEHRRRRARGPIAARSSRSAEAADDRRGQRVGDRRSERGAPTSADVITSLTPPTSVLTPGTPDAIASISATGVPSLRDVSTKTSVAA